jgi:metallo-beta-lactamase family protein
LVETSLHTSLTFLGAARTVTGSKHLMQVGERRVLVDCGLFQGLKSLRERNWQALPVKASAIDAVVLTHAHLDHCGYLPRLVSQGFRGRVFCTPGTAELARIVMADAAHLQEEDAERANRKHYTRHRPALPLFTTKDADRAMALLQPVGYERPVPVMPGVTVDFISAGHLLGSSYARIQLQSSGRTFVFGGDLGRYDRPVMTDPEPVAEADVLLVESTYGDRVHEADDDGARMADVINTTAERGGKVIIPAFALGRVEEVLYWIGRLEDARRIPVLPVFVDSPMARAVLDIYGSRLHEMDADVAVGGQGGTVRTNLRRLCAFCTQKMTVVSSISESRAVQQMQQPSIVISSSGMATGGRVLHHLAHALPDDRNTVLFVGHQAVGTRGRQMLEGAAFTRIHGLDVPIRAHVASIESMSAHADSNEIMRWLGGFKRPPTLTCLVHGEPAAMDALKARIERELRWRVATPVHQERIDLSTQQWT